MIVNEGVFEFTNGLQVSSRGSLLAVKRRRRNWYNYLFRDLGQLERAKLSCWE